MSLPTLPPPPPGPWDQPATPVPTRTSLDSRPAWRQGRPGWTLLHLLIGTAVWIAGLVLLGVVLGLAGRSETEIDRIGDEGDGAVVLFLAAAIVGWFLFAYSAGSAARRWAIFGCISGGAWLIMVAILLGVTR